MLPARACINSASRRTVLCAGLAPAHREAVRVTQINARDTRHITTENCRQCSRELQQCGNVEWRGRNNGHAVAEFDFPLTALAERKPDDSAAKRAQSTGQLFELL